MNPNFSVTITLHQTKVCSLVQGLTALNNANAELINELNNAYIAAAQEANPVQPVPLQTQGENNG